MQAASNYIVTVWRLIFLIHFLTDDHKPFIEPEQLSPAMWAAKEEVICAGLLKKMKQILMNCPPE